ncbi:hypothetical protein GJA_862 [Janthinobacterium agaricidamnosum NBRC 102515 = DSM 9628]|uniref:Uncharacterized protein n=1 Tax=Janthinobacterium agaricidamnosum NBRC 102515 = DSM 9628 TaxID=1349767 RepID=W0UY89_9BURK|nr:hypothetical protein GJA_862 [Janthinobacterium agaricidamnosum NBRC 102515 = DSM 9628]
MIGLIMISDAPAVCAIYRHGVLNNAISLAKRGAGSRDDGSIWDIVKLE